MGKPLYKQGMYITYMIISMAQHSGAQVTTYVCTLLSVQITPTQIITE